MRYGKLPLNSIWCVTRRKRKIERKLVDLETTTKNDSYFTSSAKASISLQKMEAVVKQLSAIIQTKF